MDVEEVMQRYNAIFLHGIVNGTDVSTITNLHRAVDWRSKLEIALAFDPTLAACSHVLGGSKRALWSTMGVVVNRGTITEAFQGDGSTKPVSLRERTTPFMRIGTLEERVKKAIANETGGYNEIVIDDPTIMGFYVTDNVGDEGKDVLPKILTGIQPLGIPLYVLKDNELYEAEIDRNQFTLKRKLSVEEVCRRQWTLDPVVKTGFRKKFIANSPFSLRTDNRMLGLTKLTSCVFAGMDTYLLLRFRDGNYDGPVSEYEATDEEKRRYTDTEERRARFIEQTGIEPRWENKKIPDGAQVQFLHKSGTYIVSEWYIYNERLYSREIPMHGREIRLRRWETGEEIRDEYVAKGEYLNQHLKNIDSYLERVEIALQDLNRRYEGGEDTILPGIHRLAVQVYAFGDMAEEFGDHETQQQARDIAGKSLHLKEYNEFLEEHIGPNRAVRLTVKEQKRLGIIPH